MPKLDGMHLIAVLLKLFIVEKKTNTTLFRLKESSLNNKKERILMAWKIANNSQPNTRDDTYPGICPFQKKQAVVTVHTTCKLLCKTDLQKTYTDSGRRCSLLDGKWDSCLDSCPLVTGKY